MKTTVLMPARAPAAATAFARLPVLGQANTFASSSLLTPGVDPYGGMMQSRNLREIASVYDPKFRAKNDVFELNIDREVADGLRAFSQTRMP